MRTWCSSLLKARPQRGYGHLYGRATTFSEAAGGGGGAGGGGTEGRAGTRMRRAKLFYLRDAPDKMTAISAGMRK